MKRGFLVLSAWLMALGTLTAQTVKTGVLVTGNGSNAVAASIQAAVSGAKTILVVNEQGFKLSPFDKDQHSGIAAEFLKRAGKASGRKDSTAYFSMSDAVSNEVLRTWMDSLKNLTVIRRVEWQRMKRSGSGWSMELKDGRTIRAEIFVNADRTGRVASALALPVSPQLWQSFGYQDNSSRTSVASGYFYNGSPAYVISLYTLLNPQQENLIALDQEQQSFAAGQAGGAIAAYAAIFKTKVSMASLKTVQGELINYKLNLVPFSDINAIDSNWKAIQFTGLMGILKAELSGGQAWFRPEQLVMRAEIEPVLREYFYKAQLWFEDHKEAQMTLASVLSLVCTVGNKALKNTEDEVRKRWNASYRFTTPYEPSRPATRREFAVLVNDYLKPFNVNIDRNGRVLR